MDGPPLFAGYVNLAMGGVHHFYSDRLRCLDFNSQHAQGLKNMRVFGLQITLTLIIVAAIFYFVGAKWPALANKVM
jgi:hypothetical protein